MRSGFEHSRQANWHLAMIDSENCNVGIVSTVLVQKPSFQAPDFRGLFAAIPLPSDWFTWFSLLAGIGRDGLHPFRVRSFKFRDSSFASHYLAVASSGVIHPCEPRKVISQSHPIRLTPHSREPPAAAQFRVHVVRLHHLVGLLQRQRLDLS